MLLNDTDFYIPVCVNLSKQSESHRNKVVIEKHHESTIN
eukprot:jgi/Antlo1/2077/2094